MAETRKSLTDMLDRYFEALTKRDSSRLPLANNFKYTENGQRLAPKFGLWASASGTPYPRNNDFIDTETNQAATFSVIDENERKVVMGLRLKVEGGKITESEHLVCRYHDPLFDPDGMKAPDTHFKKTIDPGRRPTRARAIEIANLYFDAIEQDDGSIIPVTRDCPRFENGVQTVLAPDDSPLILKRGGLNLGKAGVAAQISTGCYEYINPIRDRHYPIYDAERGSIWGRVFMEHSGSLRHVNVKGHGRIELGAFAQRPSSAYIHEAFQIEDGNIRSIGAILDFFPFGMKSGWDD